VADFLAALPWVLRHEGGFSDHPEDKGGPTNLGITQRTLDDARRRDASLPTWVGDLTQAQAQGIYRAIYWLFEGVSDQRVATKLLDMAVNLGPVRAVMLCQRALGGEVALDGRWGPKTETAVNAAPGILQALCLEQEAFYRRIVERDSSQAMFLKGWVRRAQEVPE
jgi:lysozyme family protein